MADVETMDADALKAEVKTLRAKLAEEQKTSETLLTQLTARCEKLVQTQLEMDALRDTNAQLAAAAPDYLAERLSKAESSRRELERALRDAAEEKESRKHELKALEELLTRYQLELSSQASQQASVENQAELLAAQAGVPIADELFECQRRYNLIGWTAKLQRTDRPSFSSRDGAVERPKSSVRLPDENWVWLDEWQVVPLEGEPADVDGWSYAVDFDQFASGGSADAATGGTSSAKPADGKADAVRRRRWIRHRIKIHDDDVDKLGNRLLEACYMVEKLKRENIALQAEVSSAKALSAAATAAAASAATLTQRSSVPAPAAPALGEAATGAGGDGANVGSVDAGDSAAPELPAAAGEAAPAEEKPTAAKRTETIVPAPAASKPKKKDSKKSKKGRGSRKEARVASIE